MAKLNCNVLMKNPDGATVLLTPADEIPEWAVKAITNPHVWEVAPEGSDDNAEVTVPATPQASETQKLPIPSKGGQNSTKDAWIAYAKQEIAARELQIEIAEDASRGDIIEALETAGIPTED